MYHCWKILLSVRPLSGSLVSLSLSFICKIRIITPILHRVVMKIIELTHANTCTCPAHRDVSLHYCHLLSLSSSVLSALLSSLSPPTARKLVLPISHFHKFTVPIPLMASLTKAHFTVEPISCINNILQSILQPFSISANPSH